MSADASAIVAAGGWAGAARVGATIAAVAGACLLAIIGGNGAPELAILPLVLALVVAAAWRFPAHETLPILAFACLVLENPSEAFGAGVWQSPIHLVGALFLQKMNSTLRVPALVFSGLDLALVLLAAALVARRIARPARADPAYVPAAAPVTRAALACIATIFVVWGFGIARGGSFGNSLWQVFRVIYLPSVLLLFSAGLRGPADARRLGVVLVGAALYRSALAIHIRMLFPDIEAVPFTTIHADSMLFVDAIVLVVANLLARPSPRALLLAVAVVPPVAWAMVANHRRLAWVELLLALALVLALAPRTRLKRRILQAIVVSIPLAVVYVGIGWSAPSGVFAPVRTLRSVVDSKADSSTAWRDWENYNIAYTVRRSPLLGTGFGHEYEEVVLLPDISVEYPLYRYAPHNSVLGLLAYAGVVGFAGLWMFIPVGVFLAMRARRLAPDPRDQVALMTALGAIVAYLVHCYGDMGLGTWVSVFTVAPAIALIGKIAVASGAWPLRVRPGRAGRSR